MREISPRGKVTEYRIWWAAESRYRRETEDGPAGGVAVTVQNGARWWRRTGDEVVTNKIGDPRAGDGNAWRNDMLVHGPRRLVVDPTARVVGRATLAGREAVLVETSNRAVAVSASEAGRRVDWPVFVPGPVPLSWPLFYCLNEAGQASLEQLIAVALSLRPADAGASIE